MRVIVQLALALIPLQWFTVAPSPIGELRVHQLAMFALTACIISVYGFARIGSSTRRLQYFVGANIYMAILATALDLYNGMLPIQSIQSLLYIASFVAISALFYIAATDPREYFLHSLRWTSVITLTVLLAAFGVSLVKNGINPVSVIQQTIVTGDPSILTRQLFGQAFVGFGFDLESTQTQIRHEVFGGMLLSMYVASWAKTRVPFTEARQLLLYRASMAAGGVLVMLSLSRAVTLAALVWPAILLIRAILSGRVSGGQLLAVIVSVFGLGIVAATGFLSVLYDRFTQDTTGYVTRSENISDAIKRIFNNFWTGGFVTESNSSHNFILDNWQRSGVLVAIPAILIFVYIFWTWAALLLRMRTLSAEIVPVSAALTLPLFRMLTQGGGQISVNGWMTMAFVTGVVYAARDRNSAQARLEQAALKALRRTASRTVASSRPRSVAVGD